MNMYLGKSSVNRAQLCSMQHQLGAHLRLKDHLPRCHTHAWQVVAVQQLGAQMSCGPWTLVLFHRDLSLG